MKIYLAGRLADPDIPTITSVLTKAGFDTFSEWYTPGPEADVRWRDYEQALGIDYIAALKRPSAQNTYKFDKRNIDASDVMVAVLPCGKSAHLEIGYMIGMGNPVFLLMRDDPERWDVMYNFVYENGGGIVKSVDELIEKLKAMGKPTMPELFAEHFKTSAEVQEELRKMAMVQFVHGGPTL